MAGMLERASPRPAGRCRLPSVNLADAAKLFFAVINAIAGNAALNDRVAHPEGKVLALGQVALGNFGVDVTSGQGSKLRCVA
jgi:hypothetical protein